MLKKKILLTGASGNCGFSTFKELLKKIDNYDIRIFSRPSRKNEKLFNPYKDKIEIIWGDLLNKEDVDKAVKDQEIIIHLAALIPPIADHQPELAEDTNVGGTAKILDTMKREDGNPKIIYTSSISVYGDRIKNPWIKVSDPLTPSKGDRYSVTKIKCENLIQDSGLEWSIFRLSAIVPPNKLKMDPIMFHMPLDTSLETCDTKDVGLALVNAIDCDDIWGKIFNLGGGEKCRTSYREFMNNMMDIFGLGKNWIPEEAFNKSNFHCGFYEDNRLQNLLHYQNHSLEDFYAYFKKWFGFKRKLIYLVRPIARSFVLRKSEAYKEFKKQREIK